MRFRSRSSDVPLSSEHHRETFVERPTVSWPNRSKATYAGSTKERTVVLRTSAKLTRFGWRTMTAIENTHTPDLERELLRAKATIAALLAGEIDAAVYSKTSTPVLIA